MWVPAGRSEARESRMDNRPGLPSVLLARDGWVIGILLDARVRPIFGADAPTFYLSQEEHTSREPVNGMTARLKRKGANHVRSQS